MKCFTINNGNVTDGIAVQKMKLSGAGVEIDAVLIGETGRGRELGVLPVDPAVINRSEHGDTVLFADVGQTRSGKAKLVCETSSAKAYDYAIVCFRTPIGFRGANAHTGDRVFSQCCDRGRTVSDGLRIVAQKCERCGVDLHPPVHTTESAAEQNATIGGFVRAGDPDFRAVVHPDDGNEYKFGTFPGEIICRGRIAQGDAGGMGAGDQYVAIIPRGVVFRTGYSGRLYGAPAAHYYVFDSEKIISATWAEREVSDCF